MMPIMRKRQRPQTLFGWAIDRLKRSPATGTAINTAIPPAQGAGQALAIQASLPGEMTNRVVLFGPFAFEQRFGRTIPNLLFPVPSNGPAPMMPDQSRGAEAKAPAQLLQAPAHVDVVPGGAKARVEPALGFQGSLADSHVAAGDVLCLAV